MPGPYDSHGKNVNGVNRYDVFGSHSTRAHRLIISYDRFTTTTNLRQRYKTN